MAYANLFVLLTTNDLFYIACCCLYGHEYSQVGAVKKTIESVQGEKAYPASQQMLIYQGKTLIDGTTLRENKVAENSFLVVMLFKVSCFFIALNQQTDV